MNDNIYTNLSIGIILLLVISVFLIIALAFVSANTAKDISTQWDTSQLDIIATGKVAETTDCYGVTRTFIGEQPLPFGVATTKSGESVSLHDLLRNKIYILAKFKTFPANYFGNPIDYAVKVIDCNEEK